MIVAFQNACVQCKINSILNQRGPSATVSSNLLCLTQIGAVPLMKEITHSGTSDFHRLRKNIWKVLDKRVLFPHFYLLFLFSVPWCSILRIEPPNTHSSIFFLSCNWQWMWFLVGRDLDYNQLKDLPEGIFRNNTKLNYLWVDLFI